MAGEASERRKTSRPDDPERRGRRSEPRATLHLSGDAQGLDGHHAVKVLDISRTGARIEGSQLPAVGKNIILRCGDIDTFGSIAWSASGRSGIHFDEPIALRELVTIRALAEERSRLPWTAEEREAAADWMSGLAR
jgi:hypothetical protein